MISILECVLDFFWIAIWDRHQIINFWRVKVFCQKLFDWISQSKTRNRSAKLRVWDWRWFCVKNSKYWWKISWNHSAQKNCRFTPIETNEVSTCHQNINFIRLKPNQVAFSSTNLTRNFIRNISLFLRSYFCWCFLRKADVP